MVKYIFIVLMIAALIFAYKTFISKNPKNNLDDLKKGDRNEEVKELQKLINYSLNRGAKTVSEMYDDSVFNKNGMIDVDGIFGRQVTNALIKLIGKQQTTVKEFRRLVAKHNGLFFFTQYKD